MEACAALASIAAAITLGAMSPGPSFVLVARTSLALSRQNGLAAAAGMGVGGALFASAALLGLMAVLAAVPPLYLGLKAIGGAYLAYLGWCMWRGARSALALEEKPNDSPSAGRSFLLGLTTQLSNPKTAIIYASVFASFLPRDFPAEWSVALAVMIFTIESVWYAIVAVALSAPLPRARYLSAKTAIDRTAGAVLVLLGGRLLVGE